MLCSVEERTGCCLLPSASQGDSPPAAECVPGMPAGRLGTCSGRETTLLGGRHVQVEKAAVAAALRRQGDHDKAQQAECALPRHVDTARDAGLLHRLDVDVDDLDGD